MRKPRIIAENTYYVLVLFRALKQSKSIFILQNELWLAVGVANRVSDYRIRETLLLRQQKSITVYCSSFRRSAAGIKFQ